MGILYDLIAGTVEVDRQVNTGVAKGDSELTFKRDEHGILWSYDQTGKKVGRIYEHGDSQHDTIKEI